MQKKINLIKVEALLRLINYILITGKLKDSKVVSAMLIANTEMGKTELLNVFIDLHNVRWVNDLSTKVLVDKILPEIEDGKITHIVCPDLLKVLSHNKVVVRNVITMLNSLTEEGVKSLMFYGSEKTFPVSIKGGLIFGITKDSYENRMRYWKGIGFISRMIPISFSYTEETINEIHDYIALGEDIKTSIEIILPPKKKPVYVDIDSKHEAMLIKAIVKERTRGRTGFRYHKDLRSLARAIAYYNYKGQKKKTKLQVLKSDIDELQNVMKFINTDYTKL